MFKPLALAALLALSAATPALAQTANPFAFPQPADPGEFYLVIEIPAGGMTKYEIDADTGLVVVDRYMQMPVVYPANYGSIASSLAGDGDPLDAIVFTREPITPGALIRVRAVGVLRMVDKGEQDDKIIAVPVSDVDPTYDGIRDLSDLPAIERQRVHAFFEVYKDLPEGRNPVVLNGFGDAAEAQRLVTAALEAYRRR